MKKFILGYETLEDEHLTLYQSVADADYNSQEWCFVEATSLEEAKQKYEATFLRLKAEGKINGCM